MTLAFELDRASILDRLGGDEEIYAMMVDMFVQDIENNSNALAAALASGDAPTLQREAHTVKGLLASFSDTPGSEVALDVEYRAKQGETSTLADRVVWLQQRLREVSAVLVADMAAR